MTVASAAAGKRMRLQILGTSGFVFLSFLLRAIYSTMAAVSDASQDNDHSCSVTPSFVCDSECYNVSYLVRTWMTYTPEFQACIVRLDTIACPMCFFKDLVAKVARTSDSLLQILLSSPVAMLVALWGMTSERTHMLMKRQNQRELLLLSP
jgi:hypothetical protein